MELYIDLELPDEECEPMPVAPFLPKELLNPPDFLLLNPPEGLPDFFWPNCAYIIGVAKRLRNKKRKHFFKKSIENRL